MRALLILLSSILVIAVACSTDSGSDGDSQATNTPQPSSSSPAETQQATAVPTATPTPAPTATPALEPIRNEFTGTGSKVLGPIDLSEGVLLISANYPGSRNFIVKVITADTEQLAFNEIGPYVGQVAHRVSADGFFVLRPGQARIQVEATGEWAITASQQFPVGGSPPPLQVSGDFSEVNVWILLNQDQYILKATHSGSSNFIVTLIKSDGSHVELVINEIGSYTGEHLINVRDSLFGPSPGLYAIAVTANGPWTIDIE